MSSGFQTQLTSLLGKKINVKFSDDVPVTGILEQVSEDHIQVLKKDQAHPLLIPIASILYVQQA